jgi:DNA modification methylase
MNPWYSDDDVTLYHGDCRDVLKDLPDSSVDAIVTDPPYGLEFMGKEWDAPWKDAHGNPLRSEQDAHSTKLGKQRGGADPFIGSGIRYGAGLPYQLWCQQWAAECLRVLKPGGHMLSFGGTRTWHRLMCAIEDAGFEIRDSIAWLYGSGFPKSLDVSKAIDKAAGAEREVVGERARPDGSTRAELTSGPGTALAGSLDGTLNTNGAMSPITAPATDAAKKWQGYGTALKPSFEPVILARKPFKGTVAANVLEHGTGALNVDACRVGSSGATKRSIQAEYPRNSDGTEDRSQHWARTGHDIIEVNAGRWPTNVVLDGEMAAELDAQSGITKSSDNPRRNTAEAHNKTASMGKSSGDWTSTGHADSGGASRFFPVFRYTPKAGTAERPTVDGVSHPTVKPVDLIRWLIRLVTPPHGVVLDPFAGSGPIGEAAILEHMRAILVEKDDTYLPLIKARLSKPMQVGFDFDE